MSPVRAAYPCSIIYHHPTYTQLGSVASHGESLVSLPQREVLGQVEGVVKQERGSSDYRMKRNWEAQKRDSIQQAPPEHLQGGRHCPAGQAVPSCAGSYKDTVFVSGHPHQGGLFRDGF